MKLFKNFNENYGELIEQILTAKNRLKLASESIDSLLRHQEYDVETELIKAFANQSVNDVDLFHTLYGNFTENQINDINNIMKLHGYKMCSVETGKKTELTFFKSISKYD